MSAVTDTNAIGDYKFKNYVKFDTLLVVLFFVLSLILNSLIRFFYL